MDEFWMNFIPPFFQHEKLVVFTGPVAWTRKKTETGLSTTECNQIVSCSCTQSSNLSVARFKARIKSPYQDATVYFCVYWFICEQQILTRGLLQSPGFWGVDSGHRLNQPQHIPLSNCWEKFYNTSHLQFSLFRILMRYQRVKIWAAWYAIFGLFFSQVGVLSIMHASL